MASDFSSTHRVSGLISPVCSAVRLADVVHVRLCKPGFRRARLDSESHYDQCARQGEKLSNMAHDASVFAELSVSVWLQPSRCSRDTRVIFGAP